MFPLASFVVVFEDCEHVNKTLPIWLRKFLVLEQVLMLLLEKPPS